MREILLGFISGVLSGIFIDWFKIHFLHQNRSSTTVNVQINNVVYQPKDKSRDWETGITAILIFLLLLAANSGYCRSQIILGGWFFMSFIATFIIMAVAADIKQRTVSFKSIWIGIAVIVNLTIWFLFTLFLIHPSTADLLQDQAGFFNMIGNQAGRDLTIRFLGLIFLAFSITITIRQALFLLIGPRWMSCSPRFQFWIISAFKFEAIAGQAFSMFLAFLIIAFGLIGLDNLSVYMRNLIIRGL